MYKFHRLVWVDIWPRLVQFWCLLTLLPASTSHFLQKKESQTMLKHYTVTRMVPEQTLKSLYHNLSEHLRQGQGHRCPSSWWWWCCPPGLPPSPPSHSSPAHRPQLQESQRWIPDLKESLDFPLDLDWGSRRPEVREYCWTRSAGSDVALGLPEQSSE